MANQDPVARAANSAATEGGSPRPGAALRDDASVRELLDHGPDAFLLFDETPRCVWANDVARRTLGPPGEALVGRAPGELGSPFAGTPVERALRAALAERRVHTIRRLVTGAGRWLEVHAVPNRSGVAAHFRDVTEMIAVERALREQERRYRRLVEHASDVLVVLTGDGTVRYASPAVTRVVGRSPADIEGEAWAAHAHPDDRAALDAALQQMLASAQGTTVTVRARFARPDGRWLTVEAIGGVADPETDGSPGGAGGEAPAPVLRDDGVMEWQGIVDLRPPPAGPPGGEAPEPLVVVTLRDVTEQAAAEAALRASEATYRVLLEQLGDGIAVIDAAGDGRLVVANERLAEMTGYSHAELLAMRVPELVIDAERDAAERVERLMRGETVLTRRQLRRRDGPPLTTEISTRLIGTRIQAVIRDVTERELFEEHRRAVQKLEALGLLAGSVAHDFNNFLLAIQSNVELALGEVEGAAVAPAIRAELEDIRLVAQRAARLTRQLLTFSRKQAPQPATFPLSEAVTGIEQMLRRLVEPSVRLAVLAADAGDVVSADLGQLEQVVMNLVMNARDSMREGGVVTVAVRPQTLPAPLRAGLTAETIPRGDYAVLAVSDTGTGMTRETARRVFEPLFTTKPAGTGTGLGLWTVHAIVTQAGGYVTVDSAPGAGSTFEVWLPAVVGGGRPAAYPDAAGLLADAAGA